MLGVPLARDERLHLLLQLRAHRGPALLEGLAHRVPLRALLRHTRLTATIINLAERTAASGSTTLTLQSLD